MTALKPEVVEIGKGYTAEDLWIHDEKDIYKAQSLFECLMIQHSNHIFPRPFGVFYTNDGPCYEDMLNMQIEEVIKTKGKGNLNKLLSGRETWTINA